MYSFCRADVLTTALLCLLGWAQAGPINSSDGSYVEVEVLGDPPPVAPAIARVPTVTVLVSRATAISAISTRSEPRVNPNSTLMPKLGLRGTTTMPVVMKAPWIPDTTTAPELCTPISCTPSSFIDTVYLTDQCSPSGSDWRCRQTKETRTTCVDYAKPRTDCAYYSTSIIPKKPKDKSPTPTLKCVPQPTETSSTCTSWCSYSSRLIPNQINPCEANPGGCWRTTSACAEALPNCLYVTMDGPKTVCIPPTMVSGGCSTATYYTPTTNDNGATGYLTTSTCMFPDRPITTSTCFFSHENKCVPFSEATKRPSSSPSTITSGSLSTTATLSCAYGTTTFPFRWKLCDQQPCATSSSTVVQCKEIFTTDTTSISWSPASSSSTSAKSKASRTQSATVTPTITPGDQTIEINVDDSTLGFLTELTTRYCRGSWCENALIHSEIILEIYLKGFTSDEVRNRGLKNLNEHVLENDNTTQWWATNAITDFIAQEHAKGQRLNHTIYIDEMLQGLESEKLAEYSGDDENPTTTTGRVQEAPTLTPVCMLKSGPTMEPNDVSAFASALQKQFEQMVMKPKPKGTRGPCNATTLDYFKDAFCHCTIGSQTTNVVASTKDLDACGGYTAWPSKAASVCTAASCIKAPVTKGYASPTAPVPVSLPSCAPGGKGNPIFDKAFLEKSIEGFCNQRKKEDFQGREWLPDWRELTIPALGESDPANSDLSIYMHYEKEACLVDLTTFDIMPGDDISYCKHKFSYLLKNCTASGDSFAGGGYYSDCMWWEIRDAGSRTEPDKVKCTASPCVMPIPTKGYTSPTAALPIETPTCESYGVGWQSYFFDNSITSFCQSLVDEHWHAAKKSLPQYMHFDFTSGPDYSHPVGSGLRLYIHFEEQACWPNGAKYVEFNEIKQNDYQISEQTCKETFRKLKHCREPMVLGDWPTNWAEYYLGGGINSKCLYWRASWAGMDGKNAWPDHELRFDSSDSMDELTTNVTRAIEKNLLELEAMQHESNATSVSLSKWTLNATASNGTGSVSGFSTVRG